MAKATRPVVSLTEEDLQTLNPQFVTAMEVLRNWPLGRPLDELAALIVLKIIAVTSGQLKDLGVYAILAGREAPDGGPDDGGFF